MDNALGCSYVIRARRPAIDSSGVARATTNDCYEILQVSRNAHPLMLTKAYRLLAALYHPDNKDTGDEENFRRVVKAYRLLADPVRRAAYDREMYGIIRTGNRMASAETARAIDRGQRVENELQLRQGLLQALYTIRRNQPNNPGLSLMALTELLGCSIDVMQFTLWYLRGKKLIDTVDDGNVAITVLGVDHIEGNTGPVEQLAEMRSVRAADSTIKSLSWTTVTESPLG